MFVVGLRFATEKRATTLRYTWGTWMLSVRLLGLVPIDALVCIEPINSGMVGDRFGEVGAVGGRYLRG